MNPFPAVVKFVGATLIKIGPRSPSDLAYLQKRIVTAFNSFSVYPVLPYNQESADYDRGWLDGWKSYESSLAKPMIAQIEALSQENIALQKELTSLKS